MKKLFLIITMIMAFIILICEPEAITIKIVLIKVISLFYIWLIIKANNYFYQGE